MKKENITRQKRGFSPPLALVPHLNFFPFSIPRWNLFQSFTLLLFRTFVLFMRMKKFFFKFSYLIIMCSTILRLIVNSLYQTQPLGYTSKDRKSCNSSRKQKDFTKLWAIHIVENVIKSHWFKIIMRIKQVQMIPMVPVVPGALRKRLDNWLGNLEITSRNILETLKIVFYIYYLTPLCGP